MSDLENLTTYEVALEVLTKFFAPRPDSDYEAAAGRAQSVMAVLADADLRVVWVTEDDA